MYVKQSQKSLKHGFIHFFKAQLFNDLHKLINKAAIEQFAQK